MQVANFAYAYELPVSMMNCQANFMGHVAASLPNKHFYCPGSMLRIRINNTNPLGFGMPNQALIMHYNSPVFSINPSYYNDRYEAIATYPKENILESGWLIGEEYIAGKPAMLNIKCGKGQIVLYGFQVNFRNQTHGTFKLLFKNFPAQLTMSSSICF